MEVLDNKKSLTVIFAPLKAFNMLKYRYDFGIDKVMTDSGAEFGLGKNAKNKDEHPFERLLTKIEMKHIYTRPYRSHSSLNGDIPRKFRGKYKGLRPTNQIPSLRACVSRRGNPGVNILKSDVTRTFTPRQSRLIFSGSPRQSFHSFLAMTGTCIPASSLRGTKWRGNPFKTERQRLTTPLSWRGG